MATYQRENTFEDGNTAAATHGIHTVRRRGVAVMDKHQTDYFAALRKEVDTYPGRLELRKDLAAMAQLLAELFYDRMREEVKAGKDILESAAGKRVGYHIALADRILSNMPNEDTLGDAATIITASLETKDEPIP